MKERLILVTSEADIRVGAIYVIKGFIHGKLGNIGNVRFIVTGRGSPGDCLFLGCKCSWLRHAPQISPDVNGICVSGSLNLKNLYRVEDGLKVEATPYTVAKPRQVAR